MPYKSLLYLSCFLLLNLSCSSTKTIKQNGNQLDDDEKNLWKAVYSEIKVLEQSDFIYKNSKLESYLNSIISKLTPKNTTNLIKFRARVIKSPHLNAFTYPNGYIYIHTGLLSEIENEAQLATLLSHEMIHAIKRHAIQQKRDFETKASILSIFSIGTLFAGNLISIFANTLGSIATNISISGYSKANEKEADDLGFQLLLNAGYNFAEAPKLFLPLLRDKKENKTEEPFFFWYSSFIKQ